MMPIGSKPRLLDLCCCQGGASAGYAAAGFDVTGVDIDPQPRYPFKFIQADALEVLADKAFLDTFDVIGASMPCQGYSETQRIQDNDHPKLIEPGRELLQAWGGPWVMENVVGAPLVDPVLLCGAMFGLRTYRHRLFESNLPLVAPSHPEHAARQTKMGRPVQPGEFMHIVGNFSGTQLAREIMGAQWMTREGLREAIPTAYGQYIGAQLMAHIGASAAA